MRFKSFALSFLTVVVLTIAGCKQKHEPQQNDNGNMLLGNPSNATANPANADNYLIDHRYYIESYNKDKGGPNWVSWHLCATDLGATDRLNNIRPDETLPDGWFEADNNS